MPEDDKGAVLALGAIGISAVALITALTKKAEAAPGEVPPTDEEIRQALALILSQQVDLELKLDAIKAAQGVVMPEVKGIELIPFAYNLAVAGVAGSGVVLTELAPFTGHIKEIKPHWPDGCDALVDIRVGRGVEQFCPREGYLSLNDATPSYPFNIPVQESEEIWVEMINTDGVNPHAITVTVTLEGVAG